MGLLFSGMARMHGSGRGVSGSSRPVNPNIDWVIYDENEVEELVTKLAEDGNSPSIIGARLRDQYGVPDVSAVTGSRITGIIERDGFPEDLQNLMRRAVSITDHLEQHPNDLDAQRQLSLTEAKIRRLAAYYRGDKIPADWTYNIEKARLIVE